MINQTQDQWDQTLGEVYSLHGIISNLNTEGSADENTHSFPFSVSAVAASTEVSLQSKKDMAVTAVRKLYLLDAKTNAKIIVY